MLCCYSDVLVHNIRNFFIVSNYFAFTVSMTELNSCQRKKVYNSPEFFIFGYIFDSSCSSTLFLFYVTGSHKDSSVLYLSQLVSECVPLTISYHPYFLCISKVWCMLYHGSVGQVQSSECYFMLTYVMPHLEVIAPVWNNFLPHFEINFDSFSNNCLCPFLN